MGIKGGWVAQTLMVSQFEILSGFECVSVWTKIPTIARSMASSGLDKKEIKASSSLIPNYYHAVIFFPSFYLNRSQLNTGIFLPKYLFLKLISFSERTNLLELFLPKYLGKE